MGRIGRIVGVLSAIAVLGGCAGLPVKIDDPGRIESLGLIVEPVDEKVRVLDHTQVWGKTYGGTQFGAVGGLVEGIILAVEQSVKARSSLGGSINELKEVQPLYPVKTLLSQSLAGRLSERYAVKVLDSPAKNSNADDYIALGRDQGLDTLLRIDFAYGLAAYDGEKSSAAVDARIQVVDLRSGDDLLKKHIQSDRVFRSGNTVSRFKENGAELFRKDIESAVDGAAGLIAAEFGFERPAPGKNIVERLTLREVTCSNPYPLDLDCNNFSGAERRIELNGFRMKVAGSSNGKMLLLMYCSCEETTKDRDGQEKTEWAVKESDPCLTLVKNELEQKNVNIVKTIRVTSAYDSSNFGFLLELDSDGYSILKSHAVER